ncbi:PIN domain-containing protein [Paenibacillus sp. FSL P4-0184]|uniref:PIN domain-containing protein n=1 Tax=Paenibacillus sp. FSL P4-0184 TaxID=2921632 RepID=UPI0030FA3B07
MHFLFLDTDILIYLAIDEYGVDDEILEKIEIIIDNGNLRLVFPKNIIDEWERNKQLKVVEHLSRKITSKVKSFKEVRKYLDEVDNKKLDEILKKLSEKKDYFLTTTEKRIERIEKLFKHNSSFVLPHIDDVKIKVADLALDNKMPFQANKNSVGDAINFLTCVEFLQGQKVPLYFVTNNKNDFGSEKDRSVLHPDLEELCEDVSLHYRINIADTLNEIQSGIIDKDIVRIVEDAAKRPQLDYSSSPIIRCGKCGAEINRSYHSFVRPSIYGDGLSVWLSCPKCKAIFDTGEDVQAG